MMSAIFANRRMKALHKLLSISSLAVLLLHAVFTVDFTGAQDTAAGTAETQRSADPLLSRYLRFGQLTTKDGLSNDTIWGIAQDNQGFMWFGTFDGLNRYDGNDFKLYRHDPDDPNSLSHNLAWSAVEDQAGVFWISTEASRFRRRALCV
jgi:hypothetical protein